MKRVLIISYYWPPSGGAGVQRWLKFVKYLRHYGWEPVVYTPQNPESPETDESLFKDIPDNLEVIKKPIREPYNLYKRFIGKGKQEKIRSAFLAEERRNPFLESLSVWLRGNFFIPDARRFWIRPSQKFLVSYLQKNPADLIISTGPPHSMHLIAARVADHTSLPWIADFRDPWTQIDFYKDLKLTRFADRIHHKLELEVLKKASAVIAISRSMASDLAKLCNREYEVITNGYDEDDVPDEAVIPDARFSIAHIGTLAGSRNPEVLWNALKSLLAEVPGFDRDLLIRLVGRIDYSVDASLEKHGLREYVEKIEYIPHADTGMVQRKSGILLLLINNTPNAKSILTGKFFEYMASGRPILCIGPPDGDAASILMETNTGIISGFDDLQKTKENILFYYRQFKEGKMTTTNRDITKYSRKFLTRDLSEIMNSLIP